MPESRFSARPFACFQMAITHVYTLATKGEKAKLTSITGAAHVDYGKMQRANTSIDDRAVREGSDQQAGERPDRLYQELHRAGAAER
jgi:hypothetical protein